MNRLSSPVMDGAEDSTILYSSTAPTTPEGSYMSSPLLQPQQQVPESLDMDITQTRTVRRICCVGAGYVGGPTAAVIAFNNPQIRVTVVDLNSTRIRRWNSRHPPIYEPGLEDIVRVARDGTRETTVEAASFSLDNASQTIVPARQPNLFFSTDVGRCISEADIVLIAVNTPTKMRGAGKGSATDMTAFEAVTADVARHAKPGAIIVEKSTVPARTAHMVRETMAVHRPGVHFEILSNPEFLAAGTAVKDLLRPDRVLIGASPTPAGRKAATALAAVYRAWVPASRIIHTNVFSSELAKLVANAMLAQRISSINSIAAVCERTGADVDEVARAIGVDARIGDKFLKAGIGYGGSCFKKDVLSLVYLARSLGLDEVGDYWAQVDTMNEYSRARFAQRVVAKLNNTLAGKKLVVLGYAFKKNTNDTRESPALEIVRTLLDEGAREIGVFDPCCHPAAVREEIRRLLGGKEGILREEGGPLVVYEGVYEACAGADAVLITTDFDEFKTGKSLGKLSAEGSTASPNPGLVPVSHVALDPNPSELQLLSLHQHLLKTLPLASSPDLDSPESQDPLHRLYTEPACENDCPDCKLELSGYKPNDEYKPKERVDWAKVSYHMKKPRWLFDGKGVVDAKEMELLGFRVESVGR